jgi:hypothetical protein
LAPPGRSDQFSPGINASPACSRQPSVSSPMWGRGSPVLGLPERLPTISLSVVVRTRQADGGARPEARR